MIAGLTNKEIANGLGISHRIVEFHRHRMVEKTGPTTLPELTRLLSGEDLKPDVSLP